MHGGRILEDCFRLVQESRHVSRPGCGVPQPLIERCELLVDEIRDRVPERSRINHRVPFIFPQFFEREEGFIDVFQKDPVVDIIVGGERFRIKLPEPLLEGLEPRHFTIDCLSVDLVEEIVVVVDADAGCRDGTCGKIALEKFRSQLCKFLVFSLQS